MTLSEKPMKTETQQIADAEFFFDYSIRFEEVIYLPSCAPEMPRSLVDALEEDELGIVTKLLGIPATVYESGECLGYGEKDEILSILARKKRTGFLVKAATPVRKFHEDVGASFSWGHYHTRWLYLDSLDSEEAAEALMKWRTETEKLDGKKGSK